MINNTPKHPFDNICLLRVTDGLFSEYLPQIKRDKQVSMFTTDVLKF